MPAATGQAVLRSFCDTGLKYGSYPSMMPDAYAEFGLAAPLCDACAGACQVGSCAGKSRIVPNRIVPEAAAV